MKTAFLDDNGRLHDPENIAEALSEDVLTVLTLHEQAGWTKTGDGNIPLRTLYATLTGARWANFRGPGIGITRVWSFPRQDYFHGPLSTLRDALRAIGVDVYDDDTNKRTIERVRI